MKRFPVTTDTYLFEKIETFCRESAERPWVDGLGPRILDVGAGKGKYHDRLCTFASELVLIDAWMPYLNDRDKALTKAGLAPVSLLGRAELVLRSLRPANGNSYLYDAALAIDFIEHVKKPIALEIIAHMRRLAPRVALFTPYGFNPQTVDREHTGADYWQTHRSGWDPDDLTALGFEVEVWEGFHEWGRKEYGGDPKWSPDAIWATWRR